MARRSWWRSNRLAVVALPFLLVLAFAANAQRVVDYWWPSEAHVRVAAGPGGYVRLTAPYRDAAGSQTQTLKVRLVDVRTVTAVEPAYPGDVPSEIEVPADVRVWKVTLHFEAPPEVVLAGCEVGVLDAKGRDYRLGLSYVGGDTGGGFTCVPPDDPGPRYTLEKGPRQNDSGLDDDDDPRPPSYDWSTYLVMPKGTAPDRVRVWLKLPDYAQFSVPKAS